MPAGPGERVPSRTKASDHDTGKRRAVVGHERGEP